MLKNKFEEEISSKLEKSCNFELCRYLQAIYKHFTPKEFLTENFKISIK